jgi:hypothetical protein
MTKAQADQLTAGLSEQARFIKKIRADYKRLQQNHLQLIDEYGKIKFELKRTNSYNDSLINYLGTNMALLYKTEEGSDVYFVNLRYHIVDVFPRGTIALTSPGTLKDGELRQHHALLPEWRYLNIANELDPDQRHLVDYIRLYPDRFRTEELMEYNLRP